jgi:HrpA-like RNA helicase
MNPRKRRGKGRRGGSGGGRGSGGRNKQKASDSIYNNNNSSSNKIKPKRNLAVFEGVSEEFRIKRKEQLEEFRENDKDEEIIFGNTLTNHERRYVHALAGQLGLISKSYGKGESRYLTVRKTKKKDNKTLSVIQKINFNASNIQTIETFMKENLQLGENFLKETLCNPGGSLYMHKKQNNRNFDSSIQNKHKPLDARKSPLYHIRSKLPAWALKGKISNLIKENQVVVLSGETGCGKSTQVPQFILDSIGEGSPCSILVSQPRRISAMGLAERVATERGEKVGETVGYSVRLESRTSPQTELLYCTTGVLLRKLNSNPLLDGVTHVVVDEVHERSHFSDFLLVILREILKKRKDLRVILMSATLERSLFQQYFNNCPCIEIEGRTFPVEHYFLEDILIQTKFMGPIKCEDAELDTTADTIEKNDDSTLNVLDTNLNVNDSDDKDINDNNNIVRDLDVLSALDAIDAWDEDGDNSNDDADQLASLLQLNQFGDGEDKELDSDEELAAARLAVSKIDKDIMANGSSGHGRPINDAMNEYIQSSDESAVDITLLLSLLEYICLEAHDTERGGHDYISSLSIKRDGKDCLGGILVFLSGWSDISQTLEILKVHEDFGNENRFRVLPLHGGIAPASQRLVFKSVPPNVRKIVLATNIAETSITIDDIVVVIDGGKVKEKLYDPYTQMSSLTTAFVSHASAMQRKGRAGRVQLGKCYTLISKSRFASLSKFQVPELLRTPLQELCLQIKLLCGDNMSIKTFLANAPDQPQEIAVRDAIISLKRIGALDEDEKLTMLGYYLGKIPLEPRLARMAMMAIPFGCFEHIVSISCSLGYRDPFMIPLDNKSKAECDNAKMHLSCNSNSDHIANIFALKGYEETLKKSGESGVYGFCRRFFLSHSTMRMIYGMKQQVIDQFKQLKLLKPTSNAWLHANRHAMNTDVLKTVLAFGLYPNLLRRHPTHKNFQGRGNRKCRVQKSSVTNLKGGALTEVNAKNFTWICFGEMLKGDRSELVRDATILSPMSILFCTGSPYKGNGDQEVEEDQQEVTNVGKDDLPESTKYGVMYIDEGVKFNIDKTLIYPIEILRGLIHTALENIVLTNENDNVKKNNFINDGIEAIVKILNEGHRSCGDMLPQQSAYKKGGFQRNKSNHQQKNKYNYNNRDRYNNSNNKNKGTFASKKICFNFQNGACSRGNACKYSHSSSNNNKSNIYKSSTSSNNHRRKKGKGNNGSFKTSAGSGKDKNGERRGNK